MISQRTLFPLEISNFETNMVNEKCIESIESSVICEMRALQFLVLLLISETHVCWSFIR